MHHTKGLCKICSSERLLARIIVAISLKKEKTTHKLANVRANNSNLGLLSTHLKQMNNHHH